MADQEKPTDKTTKQLPYDTQSLQNISFDLAKLPENKPAESLKFTLEGGQRRRALNKVRADLDHADMNNDGKLDRNELRGLTNVSSEADSLIKAVTTALNTANLDARMENMALMRTPSSAAQPLPFRTVPVPTSATLDDMVLVNRDIIRDTLAEQMLLDPRDVDRAIRKVLPKGIEEIKLSDECNDRNSSVCMPLVPGKLNISIAPPERS